MDLKSSNSKIYFFRFFNIIPVYYLKYYRQKKITKEIEYLQLQISLSFSLLRPDSYQLCLTDMLYFWYSVMPFRNMRRSTNPLVMLVWDAYITKNIFYLLAFPSFLSQRLPVYHVILLTVFLKCLFSYCPL